jgi:phage shock protein A
MGIFTRFSDIVNSEVRSAAARSIADKKDLNRRLETLESEQRDWDAKAELALRKGREDLAKAALVEKSRTSAAVDIIKSDYLVIDEGLAKLNDDIARLENKLQDAKARQKSLLARHKTANSRLAARRKIYDYQIDDALVRFEQYTRRIDDVEGRIEAYDLGLPKDLAHEFAGLAAEESVEKELDDLKQRVSGKGGAVAEAK